MPRLECRLQVSTADGSVRVVRVPRPLLLALLCLLPASLVLAAATAWLARDHQRAQAALARAEAAYEGSRYLYQQLAGELEQVKRLNDRLRIVADDHPPSVNGQFFGVGGVAPALATDGPLQLRLAALGDATQQVAGEAARQARSFRELTRLLEGKAAELATLPTIWPARGWIASPFGRRIDPYTHRWKMHEGVDIAGRFGTPVVASADGVVVRASRDPGGYGRYVLLDHGHATETLYGHLEEVLVRSGDRVRRGDVIGYMGSTGRSTGPHLHYEVRIDGVPRNPLAFMRE